MRPVGALFWLALYFHSVLGTGQFTNPANEDGQVSYNLGDLVTISWSDTSDYDILSLGVFSSNNRTASWLIENSQDNPTTYGWVVDVDRLGFDLSSSRSFQFYIVEGRNFGQPFESTVFEVRGSPYDVLSTETETVTATATTNAPTEVTVTITNTPTDNSKGYAAAPQEPHHPGRTAGFFIGLIGGLMILMGVATFFYRRYHRKKAERNSASSAGNPSSSTAPATSISIQQQQQLMEYYAVKPPQQAQTTTRAVTEYYAPNGAGQTRELQQVVPSGSGTR